MFANREICSLSLLRQFKNISKCIFFFMVVLRFQIRHVEAKIHWFYSLSVTHMEMVKHFDTGGTGIFTM